MGRRIRNQNTILNYVDNVKDGQVRLLQVSGSGGGSGEGGSFLATTTPVLSGSTPLVSVSILTPSLASAALIDVFQASSYSSFVLGTDYAHNADPVDITHTTADGRFTVSTAGTYKIDVPLYINSAAVQLVTMTINKNGSTIFTTTPLIHSSVDPVERTMTIIEDLAAADYIEVTVDADTSTVTIEPGTTFNMHRLDHDMVDVVSDVTGSGAAAVGSGNPGEITIWSEGTTPLLSGTGQFKWDKTEKVLTLSGTMVIESGSGDFIINGGRIGVGTFAPTAPLHIVNSSSISLSVEGGAGGSNIATFARTIGGGGTWSFNGGNNDPSMTMVTPNSAQWRIGIDNSNGNLSFTSGSALFGAAAPEFLIDAGGNVGIGTISPLAKLTVTSGSFSLQRVGTPTGITQGVVGGINTMEFTTEDNVFNQATRLMIRGGTNEADVEIYSGDSGAEILYAAFDAGVSGLSLGPAYGSLIPPLSGAIIEGQVGIGTSTPQDALHTVGNVRMSNVGGAAGEYLLVLPNSPVGFVRLQTPVSHLEIESAGRIETEVFGTGDYFQIRQGANEIFRMRGGGSLDLPNHNRISVTMTGTGLASGALFDIFESSSWSVFTFTNNITAQRMSYSSAAGTFTATDNGAYMIVVTLIIEHATTSTATITVRRNGSIIYTVDPFIHSSVDPVERTISMMTTMIAGQFIEVFIDGVSTITMHAGTTFSMWKIG